MFLPDRYIKGECPNCHSPDQYGDACEVCSTVYAPTDLINPYSTLTGAQAAAEELRALLLPPVRSALRRLPQGVARCAREAAAAGRQQGARVALGRRRAGAGRLGHLARCALLRHPDPGCARQVLLRVAGCADRLPGRAQELLRERQGARQRRAAQLRGVPGGARHRADPFHRQGHHLLPHALLAGDAEVRRSAVQGARPRLRARLHHRLGREDVQVARHRHQPAALPGDRHGRGVAALLHRRQAQRERRGHRLQPR